MENNIRVYFAINSVHRGKKLLNIHPPDIFNQLNSIKIQELAADIKKERLKDDVLIPLNPIIEKFLHEGNICNNF